MNRLAAGVFAVLAIATFAAFFVAQRLKHGAAVVQEFRSGPLLSPNHDGRSDVVHISFAVKKADDVTVDVVNHEGDRVRRLISDRHVGAFRKVRLRWNGRTDGGVIAPDGLYRARVILRSQGRSFIFPRSFRLDTTAPDPVVTGVGAKKGRAAGPEVIPSGGTPTTIHLAAPGFHRVVTIYRTDVSPALVVRTIDVPNDAPALTSVQWDGRDAAGRPVPEGTYLAGVQARDRAGNRGATPVLGADGLPLVRHGHRVRGHGGITVSDLVVQAPLVPTAQGAPVMFFVGSNRQPYAWSVRRVGGPQKPLNSGVSKRADVKLTIPAPHGPAGVYLLSVHTGHTTKRVPFVVSGSGTGTLTAPRGVLVVLPALTWQGRNPVDSNGDGEPDTLDAGVAVSLARPFAGDGLPIGFGQNEADAVAALDRNHHPYDVTTDLALAQGVGPSLAGHRGVLLAGDERWITTRLADQLRAFVRAGGVLASLGTDSLMRRVKISAHQRLHDPTSRARDDVFGARILPVVNRATTLTNVELTPAVPLFEGTDGEFTGFGRFEATASLGTRMSLATDAVDQRTGRAVIVVARYGRGLVIRTGLPDFSSSLLADKEAAALYERIWTLLSR